uniref:DNA repair and recombination protein RAD54-like n=1 Tax=Photinus pyralis TaxID=7054 RepID=A0A1Y1KDE8_PHOPY
MWHFLGEEQESLPTATKQRQLKNINVQRVRDDGCIKFFKSRLDEYYKELEKTQREQSEETPDYVQISASFKVPYKMWNDLYSYQQKGVKWLWNIHQQSTGGLLGDEMGLGKTVQVIVFLAALQYSRVVSSHGRYTGLGATLIVVPATVIHQWVKHFHDWAPEFRVAVLHQSGSFTGNKSQLMKEINKSKGILITTYSGVLKYKGYLSELPWHYLILDEGHKIRNHNAKVSIAIKQLTTPHRIMLTGSPMQNNLQELWSLFDFIVPGMLGNLTTFMEHVATPIMQGGYTNATPMQEATALSVATALKDLISPHLLRRSKKEVQKYIHLPNKSEQVLFCSLTDEQRDLYKNYLMGDQVGMILKGRGKNWFAENHVRANVLVAITMLRKICNHPDLYLGDDDSWNNSELSVEDKPGYYKRSGKMVVVSALLKIWKKQKHRVLLFTQARTMIAIFEEFLNQQGYKYLKMDGGTSISSRQPLINKFNEDSTYDVFLLTTRVGGLGVNLTGANRVIIFDPDWNPATDTQARERAWRIGQEKQVTVYRLISAGTIEEKMYQRQVWKQLLSNKVLLDPKTQKFFKTNNLYDLFSFTEPADGSNPETTNIFHNSRVSLQEKMKEKKNEGESSVQFSDAKIEAMRSLAQQIAKSISNKNTESNVIQKTSQQKELEAVRLQKLQKKEVLKKLSPMELRLLNRNKLEKKEEVVNKIDDVGTNVSFSNALALSEKTSELYHKMKNNKKELPIVEEPKSVKKGQEKKESKGRKKLDVKVDTSGIVDGEVVEGLLKKETKKHQNREDGSKSSQDDYVLEKLFTKKGVQGALEHESIVQCSDRKENQMKLKWEAQQKTELALQALRKSRLSNWRW